MHERTVPSWETSAVPVLAIDTSAAVAVSLCADDGAVLAARSVDSARHHAELLAPMIRDVLAEAGLAAGDVRAVVVGTGPAPFTGLRAGLVTARMFARARGIPLFGVSALDALAAPHLLPPADPALTPTAAPTPTFAPTPATSTSGEFVNPGPVRESGRTNSDQIDELGGEIGGGIGGEGGAGIGGGIGGEGVVAGREVVAVADARRREVYLARFRAVQHPDGGHDVALVTGPLVDRPDALAGLVQEAVVVGRGAALHPEAFPGAQGPEAPDPAVLARLAITRARRGVDQPAEPLYLRRPDAVPAAGRKRATG